jgi:hypothetical protein
MPLNLIAKCAIIFYGLKIYASLSSIIKMSVKN